MQSILPLTRIVFFLFHSLYAFKTINSQKQFLQFFPTIIESACVN